jgi:hypothetical protein
VYNFFSYSDSNRFFAVVKASKNSEAIQEERLFPKSKSLLNLDHRLNLWKTLGSQFMNLQFIF